jgi:hypothetical protein
MNMDAITLVIINGLTFGLFASRIMVPMKFNTRSERWEALGSAFVERS